MKRFLLFFFFSIHDGFHHKDTASVVNFSYPNFKIRKINKYSLIFFLRSIFLFVLKIIYLPISLIFYFNNTRIVLSNPYSIGSHIEEIESVIKKNLINEKKFKLILIAPSIFCHNNYINKIFFENYIIHIRNIFLSILLLPLGQFKFISFSAYINKNNYCIFPPQFLKASRYIKKEEINKNFSVNILFENIKNHHETNSNENIFELDENLISKKEIFIRNKIKNNELIVIHVRNEKIHEVRNSNISKYYDVINYLIKKKYSVLLYYNGLVDISKIEKPSDFKHVIELKNKELYNQIFLIKFCKLFICSLGGPLHIANNLLKKETLIIDSVQFNNLILCQNFINLPKLFFDKKLKRILKMEEIFDRNFACIWDKKSFDLEEIKIMENDSNNIINGIQHFLNNSQTFLNFSGKDFYTKGKFSEFLGINRIPDINDYKRHLM